MASKEELVGRCVCIEGIPGSVQNGEVVRSFLQNCNAAAVVVRAVENQPFEWVALLKDHSSARQLYRGGKTPFAYKDQGFTVTVTPSNLCSIPDDWVGMPLPTEESMPSEESASPDFGQVPQPPQHLQSGKPPQFPAEAHGQRGQTQVPHLGGHPDLFSFSRGQMGQGQMGQGQMLQGQMPQGQMGRGQMGQGPMGQGPMGRGQMGQGQLPQGQMPQGQMPQGQMPQGQMPYGQMPPGFIPQWPFPVPPQSGAGPPSGYTLPPVPVPPPGFNPSMAGPAEGQGSFPSVSPDMLQQFQMFQQFMQQHDRAPASMASSHASRTHSNVDLPREGQEVPHMGKSHTEPAMTDPAHAECSVPPGAADDSTDSDFTAQQSESDTASEMGEESPEEEKPAKVRVWNLPSDATEDDLTFYFENQRKKGGGEIKLLELKSQKHEAIIEFVDPEAVERVLQNAPHLCKNKAINVERYLPGANNEPEMEDEETPLRTVEISGVPLKVSEELIENYLENRRRGGGPFEDYNFKREEGTIIVTFVDAAVAENFVTKKHMMEGKTLTVKMYIPPPPPKPVPMYGDRLLISGVAQTTTLDCLTNFLEAKINCEPEEFICADKPGVYMIVFKEEPDIERLQKVCQERKLEGAQLTVSPVPVSCTVKVKNLSETTTLDSMELYFESKRSTGGDVTDVKMLPDENACLVTFQDPEVALRVSAKKDHRLDRAALEVSLFHECLGVGGGCHPEDFQLPAPVELKQLDKYKMLYLRGTTSLLGALEEELKEAYVHPRWPKKKNRTSVHLECTLTPEVSRVWMLLPIWGKNAEEVFQKFLRDHIIVKKKEVLQSLWSLVEEKLASIESPDREAVTLFVEKDNSCLIVAGVQAPASVVYDKLEKLATSVEEEVERQRREIEETVTKLKPHQLHLLRVINFSKLAVGKFPNLQVQMRPNGITFKGQHQDVKNAQVDMYQRVNDVSSQKLTHFSQSQLALMCNKEMRQYLVEKLKADKVIGVWEVLDKTLIIHALSDREAVRVADIVKQSLVEFKQDVDAEARAVLSSQEWHDLVRQLHASSPGVLKIVIASDQSFIQITANDQIAHGLKEAIVNFLHDNAIYKKEIAFSQGRQRFLQLHKEDDLKHIMAVNKAYKVKVIWTPMSTKFTVSGTKDGLKRALQKLEALAESVCYSPHVLSRPGIKKLISSQKGRDSISFIEKTCRCVIEMEEETEVKISEGMAEASGGASTPLGISVVAVCSMPAGRKLYVAVGDITQIKADVIVNAANARLDHCGGLAKAIVDKGGLGIQEECTAIVKKLGQVLEGDVAVSGPGKLSCKILVHAVGPMWQGGYNREEILLRETIFKSLESADKHSMTSIAIPAISTGIFGYPAERATQTIVQAVNEHFKSDQNSSIKEVFLCDISRKIPDLFIDAAKQFFGRSSVHAQRGAGGGGRQHYGEDATNGRHNRTPKPSPHDRSGRKQAASAPVDYKSVIQISIVKGEIAQQHVDVIVNTTSKDLNLTNGAVSKSILTAAGPYIQVECSQNYPTGIRLGDIAETGPGNLGCQRVYHTVLPNWGKSAGAEKGLVKLVEKILTNASVSGYQSLALPALGTGQLGYPRDVVARCLFKTISDFGKQNPQTGLTDVKMVLYHGDQQTIKTFEMVERGTVQGQGNRAGRRFTQEKATGGEASVQAPSASSGYSGAGGEFKFKKFRVMVKQGDITKEKVDAIVNSTNDDLNLKRGAVSQAILKACGSSIVDECRQKADDMKKNKIVTTNAQGLRCQYVIHISGEHFSSDWKKAIIRCLKEADNQRAKSIALPLLGTAGYNFAPEDMAVCLSDALHDYKPSSNSCLAEIHIVIFQDQMLKPFSTKLHECMTKGKGKGFLSSVKDFFMGSGGDENTSASHGTRSGRRGQLVPHMPQTTLYLHAADELGIRDVKEKLDSMCDKEIMEKIVKDDQLTLLEPSEVDHIVAVGMSNDVYVDGYSRRVGQIRLQGLPEDVMKTNDAIQKMLRDRLEAEHQKQHAEMMSDVVQWKFVEITATGQNRMDYERSVNLVIETAYRNQKKTVRFTAYEDDVTTEYEIDFKRMVEYPTADRTNTVDVVRTDKVKGSSNELPPKWSAMKDTEDVLVVPLQPTDQEYQSTVQKFGLGNTIIKVERIQSRTLFQQYQAKKQQMEAKQAGGQVEHRLWHGTASDAVFNINTYGFNRSYCGKNATAFGDGVYFAVNPQYSASNTYARPDMQGQKRVYLVRVLTGHVGQGQGGLRVPPVRQGQELFDSVADNPHGPSMYIIFSDTQAYPEYLITFQ